MINYTQILNDPIIIDIYNEIKQDKIFWADHSLQHINSVLNNIAKIYELFNLDKNSKNLCLISGVLHDVGALQGKKDHAKRSYEYAKSYLEKYDFLDEEKSIILNAILNHSIIDQSQSLENKILVFADKCDITKNRVTKAGLLQEGIREYKNIEKIDIDLKNNTLLVDIVTNKDFNLNEFKCFYFTNTLISAVHNLATELNINYLITTNKNTL